MRGTSESEVSFFLVFIISFQGRLYPGRPQQYPSMEGDAMLTQKQFYKTKAWQRARWAFIQQRLAVDGGLCQVCGEEPGLIVHHKIWLDDENCNDPDISLNADNFLYECQTCHNKERDPRRATPGRCLYGPDGEIIRNCQY